MSAKRRFPRGFGPASFGLLVLALAVVGSFVLLHRRGPGPGAGAGESSPATVTLDRVELRSQPARDGAATAALTRGDRVRVTGERGPWVEVEPGAGAGARGFLPAESVERDSDRDARQRRAKTLLAFPPVYGVVGEDAEIVLAPDPLAPRGGRLTRGTVIPIHSVDHSYFAFRDEKLGLAFVNSSQVDLVPRDPRQPAIRPEKTRALKNLTVVNLNGEPPPEEEPPADFPVVPESEPVATAPKPPPGSIEPPSIRTRVDPAYPEAARRAGIEGTVELEVAIDASGKVTDVEVVRGLPLGLSDAAADAVRRWTYRPARGPGGPVASRKTVRIRFALEGAQP